MFKVACSRKEASCIIGSLLVELAPVCEKCGGSPDGVLNLQTEAGLSLTGNADVLITGHSIISGKPVRIKLTDYGFEYYGDRAELARVREKRCVYHGGTVSQAILLQAHPGGCYGQQPHERQQAAHVAG